MGEGQACQEAGVVVESTVVGFDRPVELAVEVLALDLQQYKIIIMISIILLLLPSQHNYDYYYYYYYYYRKGKAKYSSLWESISELRGITCHMDHTVLPATRHK